MKLQLRRDTSANWAAANPILLSGEPGFETDTGLLRIGDGVTAFADLNGIGAGGGGFTLLKEGTTTADFLPSGNGNENPWSVAYAVDPHDIPATGYKLTFDFLAAEKIKDTGSAGLVPDFNAEGIPTFPSNGYDMWNWNSRGTQRVNRNSDATSAVSGNDLNNGLYIRTTNNGIETTTPFEYIHAELFLRIRTFNTEKTLGYNGVIITKPAFASSDFYEIMDFNCLYNGANGGVIADDIITRFGFIFNFNAVADDAFERIITNGVFHTALYSY